MFHRESHVPRICHRASGVGRVSVGMTDLARGRWIHRLHESIPDQAEERAMESRFGEWYVGYKRSLCLCYRFVSNWLEKQRLTAG